MPLAGRNANLKATSLVATTSTGNAATLAGDGLSIQINSTARRHWDPDGLPVLYLNSTAVSSSAYTVNNVQGKFEFASTQSTGTYTIDADYLTASAVGGGQEWTLNVETDAFEITEFGSSGWREFQPNMSGATASLTRFWNDETFFDYLSVGNAKFLIELIVNNSQGWRYEGFGYVTSDQINTSVDSIVGETVQITIDGKLYFTT